MLRRRSTCSPRSPSAAPTGAGKAVDLAAGGLSQVEIAERLGITKQAVSQRLHAADWHLEPPARELAAHLLAVADASAPADRVERP